MLEKRRIVLGYLRSFVAISPRRYEDTNNLTCVEFVPDEATENNYVGLVMDSYSWKDMGSPSTMTVTIEPGDKLNEAGD